jgi:uncharacterized protein YfaS (alpha-2-macroglobulin family)
MKRLLLLFLCTLFLFGCDRQQAPKKTSSSQPVILSTTVAPNSAFKMSISFDPPQPLMSKETRFTLTLTDLSGSPVNGANVKGALVMPLMDMGKNEFSLQGKAGGVYEGTGQFTMSGEWEVVCTADAAGKSGKTTFNVRVED